MTVCPRPGCARRLKRGWCEAHGTMVEELPYIGAVETPTARRRKDLAAWTGSPWSARELRFVRRFRNRLSVREMARRLNRSPKGVTNLLSKNHWRKSRVATSGPDRWSGMAVGLPGKPWTRYEDEALFASIGVGKGNAHLISHRSREARRQRLLQLAEGRVTDQDGMLSVVDVAREYRCSVWRVRLLVKRGTLPARKASWGVWRIDPANCEAIRDLLRQPKRTWQDSTPDMGDYEERYGLRWIWDGSAKRARRVAS